MTTPSLPQRQQYPTKDQLLQKHWYEFLLYLKGLEGTSAEKTTAKVIGYTGIEAVFWAWYVESRMEPTDAEN